MRLAEEALRGLPGIFLGGEQEALTTHESKEIVDEEVCGFGKGNSGVIVSGASAKPKEKKVEYSFLSYSL